MTGDRERMERSAPRTARHRLGGSATPPLTPRSVEVATPLWASATGLGLGVVFCGLAAHSASPFETVALLAGAAAAGGVGVYGVAERLAQRRAGAEWRVDSEARALIEAVDEPMAALDRFGRVVAANAAAAQATAKGRPPTRAVDLLSGQPDAEEIVYRLLGAALSGRPADIVLPAAEGDKTAISVWPIGGGMALWRQGAAGGEGATPRAAADARAPESAPAPVGAAADAAQIGWFRVDAAGRLLEYDRIFARWLGARAGGAPPALRTVLPEARLGPGAEATRSRLIGAPGAPREVAVLISPLGRDRESVGVAAAASPARGPGEERAPAAAAEELRLFEMAPYGVVSLDAAGRIDRANLAAERIFAALGGESPSAGPHGDHLFDWVAEKDAERVRRAFAAAARGGRGAEATLIAEWAEPDAPAGEGAPLAAREVEIAFRPLAAAPGDAPRVVAFLQDASERLGLERRVAEAQRTQAIGVLAGGLAHDFNNMLAVIIGGCDMLMGRKTAEDPDAQELQMILQSAQRAETLVRQLLAYSRQQHLDPTVADLTEVVSDISLMLNRALSDRWFLQRDLAESLWPVLVDVHHLAHVVMNMVVNAKDAMPKGGKIVVRTQNVATESPRHGQGFTMPPGAYVRLDVIDEGEGMSPEIQAKIFEPFFTTKKVGKGTGLGLSMAFGVIKQSHGFLFVDSAPGEGAMFSIYLPRASEEAVRAHQEAERAAADRARLAAATPPGRRVILVVEDEAAVRNMAATLLRTHGYDVIEAADGGEALEILEDESVEIDLMLSDVVMPDMDGPSVLRALGPRRPGMRTVFMTGYARDNFAETLDDAFAEQRDFGVLQKPFRQVELYQAVAEALGAE